MKIILWERSGAKTVNHEGHEGARRNIKAQSAEANYVAGATETRKPERSALAFSGSQREIYSALMLARNSLLPLVLLSLSISNSMASTGESGFSTLRRTQMRERSSFGMSSSSLRVPER